MECYFFQGIECAQGRRGLGRGRQAGILVKTKELSGRPGPDSTLKGTLGAVLFEGLPFMECVLEQFRTQYA